MRKKAVEMLDAPEHPIQDDITPEVYAWFSGDDYEVLTKGMTYLVALHTSALAGDVDVINKLVSDNGPLVTKCLKVLDPMTLEVLKSYVSDLRLAPELHGKVLATVRRRRAVPKRKRVDPDVMVVSGDLERMIKALAYVTALHTSVNVGDRSFKELVTENARIVDDAILIAHGPTAP